MRIECETYQGEWDTRIPMVTTALNSRVSTVTGEQPHRVVFGINHPGFEDHTKKPLPTYQV